MLARMSSAEFSEWMAYYQIEPFGEDRADLRMGILASLQANMQRDKKSKAYLPQDFMPYQERRIEKMSDKVKALFGTVKDS